MLNARLFKSWNDLPEALRSGNRKTKQGTAAKTYSMNCMPTLKSSSASSTG